MQYSLFVSLTITMAFSMESWVVRKKRTMMKRSRKNESSTFNNLNDDIQLEILKRLGGRHASVAMCVSNTWHNLILHTSLPMEPQIVVTARTFPHSFMGLEHLFNWCSRVMHYKVTPKKLIDTYAMGCSCFSIRMVRLRTSHMVSNTMSSTMSQNNVLLC